MPDTRIATEALAKLIEDIEAALTQQGVVAQRGIEDALRRAHTRYNEATNDVVPGYSAKAMRGQP